MRKPYKLSVYKFSLQVNTQFIWFFHTKVVFTSSKNKLFFTSWFGFLSKKEKRGRKERRENGKKTKFICILFGNLYGNTIQNKSFTGWMSSKKRDGKKKIQGERRRKKKKGPSRE